MDLSLFSHPAVLTVIVSSIVGLIVKAVRLQGKVDDQADEIKWLTETVAEQKGILTTHKDNSDIHFNLRTAQEVDKRTEQRFTTIERQLSDIIGKLDRMANRV